jgi:chromate transporter
MNAILASRGGSTAGEDRSYPSLSEAARTWARVALLSFGGPAGQIAVMHRIIVDEKRWISEDGSCTLSTIACCCPDPKRSSLRPTLVG